MNGAVPRLTRSNKDRVFGGVCGGLAQYIGHDAVLVRVGFVALALLTVPGGVLLYLFAWAVIPLNRDEPESASVAFQPEQAASKRRTVGMLLLVAGLVALGAAFLPIFWKISDWRIAGPIIAILAGAALILWQHNRQTPDAKPDLLPDDHARSVRPEAGPEIPRSRLARRHHGRKIAGVCAGMAEYFRVDPALVRVIWLALLFLGGTGLLLYLILWIVMPLED